MLLTLMLCVYLYASPHFKLLGIRGLFNFQILLLIVKDFRKGSVKCWFILSSEQVHRHLDQHEVKYLQFAFRWMNNLLMREVPLRCTIRLWDTYQVSTLLHFHISDCVFPTSRCVFVLFFLNFWFRVIIIWESLPWSLPFRNIKSFQSFCS